MRYDGPGKTVVRVADEDFEFNGQQIRKGQRLFLVLSVANRDPLAFEDAEQLAQRLASPAWPTIQINQTPHDKYEGRAPCRHAEG